MLEANNRAQRARLGVLAEGQKTKVHASGQFPFAALRKAQGYRQTMTIKWNCETASQGVDVYSFEPVHGSADGRPGRNGFFEKLKA